MGAEDPATLFNGLLGAYRQTAPATYDAGGRGLRSDRDPTAPGVAILRQSGAVRGTNRPVPVILAILGLLTGIGASGPVSPPTAACTPGLRIEAPAASRPGVAVPVTGTGSVVCPTPESTGGGSYGASQDKQVGPPGQPGQPCTAQVQKRLEFTLTDGGEYLLFWIDPMRFQGIQSGTPEPIDADRLVSGTSPQQFFMDAGQTDYWVPYTLNGKWDQSGFTCVPKDPNDIAASFTPNCNFNANPFPACLIRSGHDLTSDGLPASAIPGGILGLKQQVTRLINPGTITAWPAQPIPGLVNAPTCFFVDQMNVPQSQSWDIVLAPPTGDPTNRVLFYTFRIQVSYQGTQWDFGDGNPEQVALPRQCLGVSQDSVQTAHPYHRYSDGRPGNAFQVTATETYAIQVTEYWADSRGVRPPLNLGDGGAGPITVSPNGLAKTIIQEEGVPIGQ